MEQAAVTGVEAALAKGRAAEPRSPLLRAEKVQGSTQRALDRALDMANKRGEELEAVRGSSRRPGRGGRTPGWRRPSYLGVTSCPPPTWRYGPRKSML